MTSSLILLTLEPIKYLTDLLISLILILIQYLLSWVHKIEFIGVYLLDLHFKCKYFPFIQLLDRS
jgi:hypothetical protein